MSRILCSVLMVALALCAIGLVRAQDLQISKRHPVQMAFYQDAYGIDAQIEEIKKEVLKRTEDESFSMKGKDPGALSRGER